MAKRQTKVTEAELKRAIRAAEAAGRRVKTIIAGAEGYVLQLAEASPEPEKSPPEPPVIL